MKKIRCLALVGLTVAAYTAVRGEPFDPADARSFLGDMRRAVEEEYFPADKVTPAFTQRCRETEKALADAKSQNEAYAMVADALGSLDTRIRIYPPKRSVRVDYSWEWRIVGETAYVTQVDREGDANKQGLKLGDHILSMEGIALNRENYQQVYYAMNTLAPRAGLRIQVQSPGEESRWLAIASTLRPQRKTRTVTTGGLVSLERVYTKEEHRRFDEFREVKNHVRRVGQAAVWRADDLRNNESAVADGLKLIRDASALILDLRGQYVRDHHTVLRLLNGLFSESFESGVIQKYGGRDKLRVRADSGAFKGTLLVLVDSETASYAEVLARIIQQRQRGVIIGDRTMGRAFEEILVSHARGVAFNFNLGGASIPSGEVLMADAVPVDGRGVIPDYKLLPVPADLAGHRDLVMSKAMAMLKETLSPEEAYKLFPHYEDVDDDF